MLKKIIAYLWYIVKPDPVISISRQYWQEFEADVASLAAVR